MHKKTKNNNKDVRGNLDTAIFKQIVRFPRTYNKNINYIVSNVWKSYKTGKDT